MKKLFLLIFCVQCIAAKDLFYQSCYTLSNNKKIPFKRSAYKSKNQKKYEAVKTLYTITNAHNKQEKKTKIPKIIHQIWLGPKQLPVQNKAYRSSWQQIHGGSEWIYRLWRDKDFVDFPFINKKAFDTATNPGEKSDIARLEILYRFGGVYADDDMMCLKPFDQLHEQYTFYAGLEPVGEFSISNALIGSVPGNPFLLYCLERIKHEKNFQNDIKSILARTGPVFFTHCILKNLVYLAQSGGIILPTNFFYPLPFKNRYASLEEQKLLISPDSMAVHYWSGLWKERKKK